MRALFLILISTAMLAACDTATTTETPLAVSNDRFDRTADIINDTNHSIVRLHAQNDETQIWTENLFGNARLAGNQRRTVNVDDGTGACIFNFRATMADGQKVRRQGLDVCHLNWWRIFTVRR